jgi:acyl-[acyl carrier protein]--UDP-N-acetylglucosamine O-acyltransferase
MTLFRSDLRLAEAVKKVRDEFGTSEDVQVLLKFLDGTKRGICKGSDEREEE